MKRNKKVLVVCSGGLDSTVALYRAKTLYNTVEALTFGYGQNHAVREFSALQAICRKAKIRLTKINLSFIGKHFTSSLLGGVIPTGAYNKKNMASTVVPFRNGVMLAIAAGFAESRGFDAIMLGNHSGDHYIYPDCRPEFISAMTDAVEKGTKKHIKLISPFCLMTKSDIVKQGEMYGAPLNLTYSCYKGGKKHCGVCGTCRERKEAFIKAGVVDKTEYEK